MNNKAGKERILMMNYSSSLGIAFIYPVVICILEALMLIYSFVNSDFYGPLLSRYRLFYSSFLIVGVLIMALNLYVKKDVENRYRILNISNPLFAAFSFAWALILTYSDSTITHVMDPVIFMTFSLTVPLCIFLRPKMYAFIISAADIMLVVLIISQTEVSATIINYLIFFAFQLIFGLSFIQAKTRLTEKRLEEEERIEAELALAAKIQTSFLPRDFPPFPERDEFELYASMTPAKEVGGDFYDFFFTDSDHLALVMADVSGKGIPAAMFMVDAKNKIRSAVMKHGSDVAAAVREANIELCDGNDAGLFVTVWLGVLTVSTGHMEYVDAGHEYPAICRKGGEFAIEEDVHSAPVAARKKTEFEAGAFDLKAGDILYLYTDGVTEANNSAGEMFRRSRMLEALNKSVNAPVKDIDSAIRGALAEFVQDTPQFDDTTMLVFRYKGCKA